MKFEKLDTKFGIPLYVAETPTRKSVAAGVSIKAGSRDEVLPKEFGLAHAREHMSFLGTLTLPDSLATTRLVDEVGGAIFAHTNRENILYSAIVPAESSSRAIHFACDLVFNPIYPEALIPTEIKNIIAELRREEDDPGERMGYTVRKQLFGTHPLGRNILGTTSSLNGFERESFIEFDKRFITRNRLAFIAVGAIKKEDARRLFETYGREVSERYHQRIPVGSAKPDREKIESYAGISQSKIFLCALSGGAKERPALILDLFSKMIDGGSSSPLFQKIRHKIGNCYEVGAYFIMYSDVSIFTIYFGTDPQNTERIKNEILEIIYKSKSDISLLNSSKIMETGHLILEGESNACVFQRAAEEITLFGQPKDYDEIMKEYESITIDEMTETVDTYLKPEDFIYTEIRPA